MLAAGTMLGPYRILAPLGSGGMGEVYRARDTRLGRDVALKVIHAELARDPENLKRFQQEARSAGALSHPNVCSIFDLGDHAGSPYVVMELLEGDSLRGRLEAGPIPVRKAVEWAAQAARGLAAAHEKGIVHRDLKPENLFVTKDGRVKVLDFGLAKLTRPDLLAPTGEAPVSVAATASGAILGTVGYMSPEQVLGRTADGRSDLFALGTILYEMLTGKRAFQGATYVQILNAILNDEPAPIPESGREILPVLDAVVRRCLEKDPAQRFQDASDLAFALENLPVSSSTPGLAGRPAKTAGSRWRRPSLVAAVLALLALNDSAIFIWARRGAPVPIPSPERVTFRRGIVQLARFTPDGQSVIYNAKWVYEPWRLYSQRLGAADARILDTTGAAIKAVSGGEMLTVSGDRRAVMGRRPLDGGTPREMAEDVLEADWSVDGTRMVVVRNAKGHRRVESPVGKVILEPSGGEIFREVRFSPRGDRIAFVICPFGPSDPYAGDIAVMDFRGRKRVLSQGWRDVVGLGWSPDGEEIWFTGSRTGTSGRQLHAVSLSGRERLLARMPGAMILRDVARDGRALVTLDVINTLETRGRAAGDVAERDLSWLDGTCKAILAPDGSKMLFQEEYSGGGDSAAVYLRRMDGSAPVRLADGRLAGVTPDWRWALCYLGYPRRHFRMVPVGAGEPRLLDAGRIEVHDAGIFSADGSRYFLSGAEPGGPERLYALDAAGGPPAAEGPAGLEWGWVMSADGRCLLARPSGSSQPWTFQPIAGGEPRPVPGIRPQDRPLAASSEGRSLFVREAGPRYPIAITRLDLASGRREPWLSFSPPSPEEVSGAIEVTLTPDGRCYAYYYMRRFADLYVISGLR